MTRTGGTSTLRINALLIVAAIISSPEIRASDDVNNERSASLSGSVEIVSIDGEIGGDNGGAVVFLDGSAANPDPAIDKSPVDISQLGAQFTPTVLPVVRGTTIRFMNDDNIFHNVFSLSAAATFDLGIFPKGTFKQLSFDKTGLVNVYCNIHPQMVSRILVLSNPWFATTDTDGSFHIENIPPGTYTLRVWHELGGELSKSIELKAGEGDVEVLSITNTTASLSHKNKFGKPYREKY